MKALDTNVLVRFLVNDDKKQAAVVRRLFSQAEQAKDPLYVPNVVILELMWVLGFSYEISRADIIQAIEQLTLMPIFKFEDYRMLQEFINDATESRYDLSDLFIGHCAQSSNGQTVLTFDKKAAKSDLFELLK